jgi:hypothetical protein
MNQVWGHVNYANGNGFRMIILGGKDSARLIAGVAITSPRGRRDVEKREQQTGGRSSRW